MVVELRPHQQKAVDKLSNGKVLYGGTGSGKTITSLAYFVTKVCKGVIGDYGSMRTPKDVIVITTATVRDKNAWHLQAAKFGLTDDRSSSVGGIQLTVDSWNNIGKYTDRHGAFFIFDEQRLVGSGAWVKAFIHIAKSNEWILLSATPGDNWLDYIPVFIANGWYRNRTQFKREHVVYNHYGKFPKVDHYVNVGKLVRLRNKLLVHMPYEKHTKRHIKEILVGHDVETFERVVKKRWHVYEQRPLRDVAELFIVMRKVVNSDPTRLDAIRELMKIHPRLIVFYNFDYELEILRTLGKNSPPGCDGTSNTSYVGEPSTTQSDEKDLLPTAASAESPNTTNQSSTPVNSKVSDSSRSKLTKESESWLSKSNGTSTPTSLCTPGTGSSTSTDTEQRMDRSGTPAMSKSSTLDQTRFLDTSRPSALQNDGSISKTQLINSKPFSESSSPHGSETGSITSVEVSDSSPRVETDPNGFTLAEWNGHRHDPLPTTDRWVYLVQYAAGSEGWNCTTTDATVFYSLTYSYKHWFQAFGRIDRLNTPFVDLFYYILISNSMIDKLIRKALRAKKSFNESAYGASVIKVNG